MKRIHIVLLSLLLVAAMTVTVSAAGASVKVTPSAKSVEQGGTFTLVAELSNTDKIKIGTVALKYDTDALQLTGGECNISDADIGAVLSDQNAGTFLIMNGKKVSGKLFTFEFKVLDSAATGDYTIEVEAAIGTTEGKPIDATGAKITVTARTGDAPEATVSQEVPPETTLPEESIPSGSMPQATTPETEETPPETTLPVDIGTVPTYPYNSQQREEEAATSPATNNATEAPKTSNGAWIAVAVVLVAGAAVGVVLWLRKKKK